MIKIDIKEHITEFKGTLPELLEEAIILNHSLISTLLPRIKEKEDREAFKTVMSASWLGEIGVEALKDMGLLKDVTMMDVTKLGQLMKEGQGNETNG